MAVFQQVPRERSHEVRIRLDANPSSHSPYLGEAALRFTSLFSSSDSRAFARSRPGECTNNAAVGYLLLIVFDSKIVFYERGQSLECLLRVLTLGANR